MVKIVRVPFLFPAWAGAQVLVPNTIFVRKGEPLDPYFIAHELVHIDQIERYGLLRYWFRYLRLLAKHGYGQHPMEHEADRDAGKNVERARELIRLTKYKLRE